MFLAVHSVTKTFTKRRSLANLFTRRPEQRVVALNRISFTCERGQILGVLGPNGAGKTTITKILANLLLPDQGEIWIGNQRMSERRHDFRRHIGYVNCDERSFFWRLTGRQNLLFFLSLYDCRDTSLMLRLTRHFDLERKLDTPFQHYSTGMRKKLAIIRGLAIRPDIVLFDEATNGLDPLSVTRLREILQDLCADRVVLWTTHRLEEINDICSHVLAIREGNLVFHGTREQLKDRFNTSPGKVTVTVRGNVDKVGLLVHQLFRPEQEIRRDSCYSFTLASNGRLVYEQVLHLLNETQSQLVSYEQSDRSMGDIYRSLVTD